jgi:hypothetical protein
MKLRLSVYVDPALMARLDECASQHGKSKSLIVTAALESFLAPDDADQREATATRRLVEKLQSDLHLCVETLALFIHTWTSVMPLLSGTLEPASQVKGRVHYETFIHTVSQWLATGQSLIDEAGINAYDESGRQEQETTTFSDLDSMSAHGNSSSLPKADLD